MDQAVQKKHALKAIRIYCILLAAITIPVVFLFPDFFNRTKANGAGIMMLIPTVCMVLTRLVTKEGFRKKDLWLAPMQGTYRFLFLGYYGIVLLSFAGAALYFLIFPGHFDGNMSMAAAEGITRDSVSYLLLNVLVPMILMLSFFTSLGEEWGWRGYLLPKLLEVMGIVPAIAVSGVIWGLWHWPLLYVESTGYFAAMVLRQIVTCVTLSISFSYVTLRSRSALPAACAHLAFNAVAAIPIYFFSSDVVSGVPFFWVKTAALLGASIPMLIKMVRMEKAGTLIPQWEEPAPEETVSLPDENHE